MSIIDSLLRFVDIIEFRQRQQDRSKKRKAQPPGADDDAEVALPPDLPPRSEVSLVCRVCQYQGGPEHRFCPRCLAETMERRR